VSCCAPQPIGDGNAQALLDGDRCDNHIAGQLIDLTQDGVQRASVFIIVFGKFNDDKIRN
jgi:hypothetical protein